MPTLFDPLEIVLGKLGTGTLVSNVDIFMSTRIRRFVGDGYISDRRADVNVELQSLMAI
jgi:hypothetical protein